MTEITKTPQRQGDKKPFSKPKLVRYGSVQDLTASGATGAKEGSQGNNPFMA